MMWTKARLAMFQAVRLNQAHGNPKTLRTQTCRSLQRIPQRLHTVSSWNHWTLPQALLKFRCQMTKGDIQTKNISVMGIRQLKTQLPTKLMHRLVLFAVVDR